MDSGVPSSGSAGLLIPAELGISAGNDCGIDCGEGITVGGILPRHWPRDIAVPSSFAGGRASGCLLGDEGADSYT